MQTKEAKKKRQFKNQKNAAEAAALPAPNASAFPLESVPSSSTSTGKKNSPAPRLVHSKKRPLPLSTFVNDLTCVVPPVKKESRQPLRALNKI